MYQTKFGLKIHTCLNHVTVATTVFFMGTTTTTTFVGNLILVPLCLILVVITFGIEMRYKCNSIIGHKRENDKNFLHYQSP